MEPLKSYIDYLNNNLNLNRTDMIYLLNSTDLSKYKIITNTNAIKNTILQTFFVNVVSSVVVTTVITSSLNFSKSSLPFLLCIILENIDNSLIAEV